MNVAKLEMPKEQAALKLKEYRKFLHRRADAEYSAIAEGLEFQQRGIPLINIDEAIRNGGFFEDGRPRLAIARADREFVRLQWRERQTQARFYCGPMRGREYPSLETSIDMGGPPAKAHWESFTMIPLVPAEVRNKVRGDMSNFHILWEVSKWVDRHPKAPPHDPYLLQHVGGSLYAVLAEWDLTDLERAVLAERGKTQ